MLRISSRAVLIAVILVFAIGGVRSVVDNRLDLALFCGVMVALCGYGFRQT